MLDRPANAFVAGTVVSAAIVWLLSIAGIPGGSAEQAPVAQVSEASAADLVDAWTAMRSATWTSDSVLVRTLDDGRSLRQGIHESQQPPRRLRKGGGTLDRWADGAHTACVLEGDAPQGCRVMDAGRWDGDIDALRREVLLDGRSYDVAGPAGGCFTLYARPALASGRWGTRSHICFDPATRAVARMEVRRPGGTDRVVATRLIASVDPRDLEVSGG